GVYLRLLDTGFKKEASEIGRLATLRGALIAVLGTDDPEILCRPGDTCLVKRVSGWAFLPAPNDIARVVLGQGVGWAIAGKQLLRLGASAWENAGPPGSWESADALFATRDAAWVVESAKGRIHAFAGDAWRVSPSPVETPRALWGVRADSLWLV